MAKIKPRLPFYSWDSTAMIAWLSDEKGAPLGNIDVVVAEIDLKLANLLLAVTVITEILESKHTPEQMDRFNKFLKNPNVITGDTTAPIAMRASRIRSDGAATGRSLKTPDATIMATSIIYRVDALHTLEPKLINLTGMPLVDGLRISLPIAFHGQGGLDFQS